MRIVNTELMGQPVNWVIVPLMVILGGIVIYLLNPLGIGHGK